jgi:microcystin-dependent protein
VGTPFLSEVKIISWNFAPQGWAFCNGQLLPINQNQALFSLLGTTYGGNGSTNFALPDLRSKTPIHQGQGFILGQTGGQEFHMLTLGEMPAHSHFVNASSTQGDKNTVQGNILAQEVGKQYGPFSSLTTLAPASVSNYGGSQPHENRQPYLVLNFVIALQGAFPSRN